MNLSPKNPFPLKGTQVEFPHPYKKVNLDNLNPAQKRDRLRIVAGNIMKEERVNRCGRHRIGSLVTISACRGGAMFSGVETCGSLWNCPVCAEKISNVRRHEVAAAIDGTYDGAGAAYMLTLTMKHAPFDKCSDLKEAVAKSWRKLQATRAWGRIKSENLIFGYIRALEITHGGNGWHPHLHILLLAQTPLTDSELAAMRLAIFEQWDKKIYDMTGKHCHADACDLRPATSSDYITKWGSDREIAKSNLKRGKGGSSPFQLLERAYNGDRQAVALFAEYAKAFKGARHITWSHGLKDFFRINEISDDNLAENSPERLAGQDELPFYEDLDMREVCALDKGTWCAVIKLHLRPDLLDVAYKFGQQGVIDLLAKYGLKPYLGGGEISPNIQFDCHGKPLFQAAHNKTPRLTDMPHSATPWLD